MPTSSTINSASKSKIKSSLPSSHYKILTATVARVYAAIDDQWSYTGIEGGLAFVRLLNSDEKGACGFRVVDLKGTRGVIWDHDIYQGMQYNQDRAFFHTFEGDEFLIGFSFADEGEANEFYKKVNNRAKYAKSSSSSASKSTPAATTSKKSKKAGKAGGIDKSMISSPSGFQHVAHMGFSSEHGFSSNNVDPTWAALLDQLTNMGVSQKDIQKNEKFIKDFVGQRGGPASGAASASKPPAPPAPKAKKIPPPAPSRGPTSARKQPPPPPAPRQRPGSVQAAPPPPPARPSAGASASRPPPPPARPGMASSSGPSIPPPPPPLPPSRGGAAVPPPPPPPPGRGGAGVPPPPPPPAPPSGASSAPPPPPPPPGGGASSSASSALPPPQDGRGALLASIQGAGIHQLKKTEGGSGSGTPSRSVSAAGAGAGAAAGAGAGAALASGHDDGDGAGGGDLASALAAALSQRKGNMGDSDEEGGDDSDEEW